MPGVGSLRGRAPLLAAAAAISRGDLDVRMAAVLPAEVRADSRSILLLADEANPLSDIYKEPAAVACLVVLAIIDDLKLALEEVLVIKVRKTH